MPICVVHWLIEPSDKSLIVSHYHTVGSTQLRLHACYKKVNCYSTNYCTASQFNSYICQSNIPCNRIDSQNSYTLKIMLEHLTMASVTFSNFNSSMSCCSHVTEVDVIADPVNS